MEYFSEFLWEKNARETNEDSLVIRQVIVNGHPLVMAVVCDGIASLPRGEMASSYVVSCLKAIVEDIAGGSRPNLRRIRHGLSRQLYSCHRLLNERGMGTTVCLAVIYKNRELLMQSGDSRIYVGSLKLKPVTRDHSDERGRLTRAIGVGEYKKIFSESRIFRKNEMLLLCSDGFYRRNEKLIENFAHNCRYETEEEYKGKLYEIYNHGVANGEKDNCSAVVIWRKKDGRKT